MTPKQLVFIVSDISAFQALGTAITIELTDTQLKELELKMGVNDQLIMSIHPVYKNPINP